jgi:hypothetical protein
MAIMTRSRHEWPCAIYYVAGDSSLTQLREQIVDRRAQMTYSSTKFALVALAIAGMLTASMQTASAQDKPPAPAPAAAAPAPGAPPATHPVPKMKTACGQDITSFCPDLKGAEARKCLRSHRTELSPSCVAYFKARRAAAKAKAMAAPPAESPPPAAPPKQ